MEERCGLDLTLEVISLGILFNSVGLEDVIWEESREGTRREEKENGPGLSPRACQYSCLEEKKEGEKMQEKNPQ